MPLTKESSEFLLEFKLPPDALEKAGIEWGQLQDIYADHESKMAKLEPHAKYLVEALRSIPAVHSLRYRIKDPAHLVDKIIRKRLERPEFPATVDGYLDAITDLVGVRALHLLKNEWRPIHDFILREWDLKEKPTVNYRRGDSTELYAEAECDRSEHPAGYRSVHYLVVLKAAKVPLIAEVQVRTLIEEAWSEIDHRVRYPHAVNNVVLGEFLSNFNRLAGIADEMGTFVTCLRDFIEAEQSKLAEVTAHRDKIATELEAAISQSNLARKAKEDLKRQVRELSTMRKASELLGATHGVSPAALAALSFHDATLGGIMNASGISADPLKGIEAIAKSLSASINPTNPFAGTVARLNAKCERCGRYKSPILASMGTPICRCELLSSSSD